MENYKTKLTPSRAFLDVYGNPVWFFDIGSDIELTIIVHGNSVGERKNYWAAKLAYSYRIHHIKENVKFKIDDILYMDERSYFLKEDIEDLILCCQNAYLDWNVIKKFENYTNKLKEY